MPLKIPARVKQTTTTTGVGAYDLIAPGNGSTRKFSDHFASGAKLFYGTSDGSNEEMVLGTLTAGAPDTLSRDRVIKSSNADAAVNWAAGTRDIFAWWPNGMMPVVTWAGAAQAVHAEDVGNMLEYSGAADTTVSMDALAEYPDGFSFVVRHGGTGGNLIIDPNGAETIEGNATAAFGPGASALIYKNAAGNDWRIKHGGAAPQRGSVLLNTNIAITGSTWTKINFNSVEDDPAGLWDAVNHRFIPKLAGRYRVVCGATTKITSTGNTNKFGAGVYKNGTALRQAFISANGATSESTPVAEICLAVNGSTDYIEGFGFNDNGSPSLVGGWLDIQFIAR